MAVALAVWLLQTLEGVRGRLGSAGSTAAITWTTADPPSLIQERSTTALQPEGTFFLGHLRINIILMHNFKCCSNPILGAIAPKSTVLLGSGS